MRRSLILSLALLFCLLTAVSASAEDAVIDLIANPDAEYSFLPDAPILEVYYPRIFGSDCTVLRCDGHVMMIDGSTADQGCSYVVPMLQDLGIDHVETALNTHPHWDHLPGIYSVCRKGITVDRVLIADGWADETPCLDEYLRHFESAGVPVETVGDEDVLTLGSAEISLFRHNGEGCSLNDASLCAMIRLGERTLLSLADIEMRSMKETAENPPACGLDADIMKYPHHGYAWMDDGLFELISPELTILIAGRTAEGLPGFRYASERGSSVYYTSSGPLRLRTDGVIWVLDEYPPYRFLPDRE